MISLCTRSAAAWPLTAPPWCSCTPRCCAASCKIRSVQCQTDIQSGGKKAHRKGEILSLSMNTRFVAAWPLDSPALVQLYTALLRCILQDQVSSTMPDGHAKSRRPRKI